MRKQLYFFIGTEAELIKLFPVIIECQKVDEICNIIATGQNNLKKSRILEYVKLNGKYIELSQEENIKKSAVGLLHWFIAVKKIAHKVMIQEFTAEELRNANLIVHGDTVSTMMGALVGKKLGMRVCHVEAGLRSHNLFNPFPEEIDRLITSRYARIHFAPGDVPAGNLKKVKGRVINTQQNTLLDSLKFSQGIPIESNIEEILGENYFVFVMHRQENLASKAFVYGVVKQIIEIAEQCKCVMILHEITKNTLIKFELMDLLKENANIILQPRVDYFDFMKLLKNAVFVITDGGSNQEELFYMDKPCLIMRKTTERIEGLGTNARLFNGDVSDIQTFVNAVEDGKIEKGKTMNSKPSKVIAKVLSKINDWKSDCSCS